MNPLFLFVADLHLRSAQYGESYRGWDFFYAAKRLADIACIHNLSLIVNGGDFTDVRNPSTDVISQLIQLDEYYRSKGVEMWAITGNHEMANPPWIELLEQAAESHGQTTAIKCIDRKHLLSGKHSGHGCFDMVGMPSMNPQEIREFLKNDTLPCADFLLWHGAVKEFADFPNTDSISIAEFETCPRFKNVLVGDIHIHKFYSFRHTGIIGYPGTIEYHRDDEPADKFAAIIYGDGKNYTVGKYPLITRKIIRKRIDDEDALQKLIDEDIVPTREEMPMIFIRYNPLIQNAAARLLAAKNPRSIMRNAPIPLMRPVGVKALTYEVDTALQEPQLDPKMIAANSKPLSDFVPFHVSESNPRLYTLASKLITPQEKPGNLIQAYINTELGITA